VRVVPLLLVLGALLWIPVHRLATRRAVPSDGPAASEPLAGLSVAEALRTGLELNEAGRDAESLPYFRRALRDDPSADWQAHFNYATALYNATLQIELHNGIHTYVVRSSWERIALVREAVRQIGLAEAMARTAHERATAHAAYAQMVWLWGMPWDAFVAYRQAYSADPANHDLAVRGDGLMDLLRAPAARGGPASR
jgi:tetratricopeptide (TPR) repeat protein